MFSEDCTMKQFSKYMQQNDILRYIEKTHTITNGNGFLKQLIYVRPLIRQPKMTFKTIEMLLKVKKKPLLN